MPEDLKILEGKRILIVDDEPDLVETLLDLLDMCNIDAAPDFQTAKKFLNKNSYDIAIFDIMGVSGYNLLEIAGKRGIPALIFTAHALSPDAFFKSMKGGAKAYIPKEKMPEIAGFVADLLRAEAEGIERPRNWFERLESFFEKQFGKNWLKKYAAAHKEDDPPDVDDSSLLR